MRIIKPAGVLILCCSLLAPTAMAEKSGYYRWVGDDGEVNFTQKPPVGRKSEFVATRTGKTVPVSDEAAAVEADRAASEPPQTADADRPQPQKLEMLPEKDPETCRQSQEFLQALSNKSKRFRAIDESGEAHLLGPEELEEQRKRAEEMIDLHC